MNGEAAPVAIFVVHYDEHGNESFYVFGDDRVRVFTVDERAPNDRVYEITSRAAPEMLRRLIPANSEIGHSGDERHAAIAHMIEAYQRGERHLSAVPTPPSSSSETSGEDVGGGR